MVPVPLNDLRRHNARFEDLLRSAANDVMAGGWYVLGESVAAFERDFAEYCGAEHCVGVGNGTDALELALRTLGVTVGSRVVTVANAGLYSTVAIRSVGAEPLFVDIESDSLCMDPAALEAVLDARPAAVIVTHLYGRLADMQSIVAACARWGVPLIEDCAQSHGATRGGRRAGSFGSMGCFSFYPTKNLGALGDGGAVVTSDRSLAERLRRLQQYGWGSKYVAVDEGGRNSRIDELQSAFLRVKLPYLDDANETRRSIALRYTECIEHPAISLPVPSGADCVAHLYVIRSKARESLRAHLSGAGVSSDIHYPVPDHRQPCFAERYAQVRLPETDEACAQVLTLPCFPEMTHAEIDRVVAACNRWKS